MTKSILLNTISKVLWDTTLLYMTLWTLFKIFTASDARKSNVSNANGINVCWLLEHALSCLATLLEVALRVTCHTVKSSVVNPTSGETSVKSTHACLPPTHRYTKISVDLSVDDLPSSGSIKKFIGASFFTDTHARLKTSKRTSRTKSCLYLKSENSR
jgi:hypothetical protein